MDSAPSNTLPKGLVEKEHHAPSAHSPSTAANGEGRNPNAFREARPTATARSAKEADTKHKDMADASGRILGYAEMLRLCPRLSATGAHVRGGGGAGDGSGMSKKAQKKAAKLQAKAVAAEGGCDTIAEIATPAPESVAAAAAVSEAPSFAPSPPLPSTKVGSLEIYARFPRHYDYLMSRHDCEALGDVLEGIVGRLRGFASEGAEGGKAEEGDEGRPFGLLDLGCGTGRISRLMLRRFGFGVGVGGAAAAIGGRAAKRGRGEDSSDTIDADNAPTTSNTSSCGLTKRPLLTHIVGYDKYGPMLRVFDDMLAGDVGEGGAMVREDEEAGGNVGGPLRRRFVRVDVPTAEAQAAAEAEAEASAAAAEVSPAASTEPAVSLYVCLRPASYEALRAPIPFAVAGDAATSSTAGTSPVAAAEHILFPQSSSSSLTPQARVCSAHWPVSVAVMAWSLSYVMRAQWGVDTWHASVDALLGNLLRGAFGVAEEDAVPTSIVGAAVGNTNECRRPRGAIVVVETLGNNTDVPTRRNVVSEYLMAKWGFVNALAAAEEAAAPQAAVAAPSSLSPSTTTVPFIRTDYVFKSREEGERLCNFFFASGATAGGLAEEAGDSNGGSPQYRLKECTGVWVKYVW